MYDGFSFEQMSEAFKRLHVAEEESNRRYQQVLDYEATIAALESSLATMAQRLTANRVSPEEQEARLTNLRMVRAANDKIGMIKAVRAMTSLGLKEAKDLVEAML